MSSSLPCPPFRLLGSSAPDFLPAARALAIGRLLLYSPPPPLPSQHARACGARGQSCAMVRPMGSLSLCLQPIVSCRPGSGAARLPVRRPAAAGLQFVEQLPGGRGVGWGAARPVGWSLPRGATAAPPPPCPGNPSNFAPRVTPQHPPPHASPLGESIPNFP